MSAPGDESIIRSPKVRTLTGGRRRRLPALTVLAAVTVLVGSWVLLVGLPSGGAAGGRLSSNLPINAGADDRMDISANNSPSLARNPMDLGNLAVSNRIDLPQFSCALHISSDGGESWREVAVPFPEGEELPARCYAPDVDYGIDGTLYMTYVTLKGSGNSPNALWVVSSRDGGRTVSRPTRVTGALAFQTRLTADPTHAGRLYASWLQATEVGSLLFPTTGNPIVVSRSEDGGATWEAAVQASTASRQRVVAPSPAVGPEGQLYVLFLDLGDDRLDYDGGHEGRGGDPYPGPWSLVLSRSVDQGQAWQETVVEPALQPTQRFVVFLPPSPSIAVDHGSGQVYAGFTDGRSGDPDVRVWTSADDGATFGPGQRVNDTPPTDGTAQYMPELAVAPGGRLDVLYYDRRDDPANVMNEVSLQTSVDRGRTFSRRVEVSDHAFDSRVGFGSERDLADLGSRLALISTNRRSLAVWADTRSGTDLTGKQDLGSAIVEMPRSGHGWWWRRSPGLVVVLVGLALAAAAVRRRTRPQG